MRRIRTVLGDIGTDGLGLVYSHEHLITDPPAIQKDRDLELSSYECSLRELIIFKHASELGNAASYKLFDAVTVKKVDGVAVPRKFSDYTVTVSEDLPEGVTCERLS